MGSSKRNLSLPGISPQLALLHQLTIDVQASDPHGMNSRHLYYPLVLSLQSTTMDSAQSSSSATTWTLSRSFDAYRRFQQRLLKLMQRGHFCEAECPWLYTFVKSYFPPKQWFPVSKYSCCVNKRRQALLRFITTLQSFLLSRSNASCSVIAEVVMNEFLSFIGQGVEPLKTEAARFFTDSFYATTSDEEEQQNTQPVYSCMLCQDSEMLTLTSRSRLLSYFTSLSCGHQFHEECIIEKLNESLCCPTCGRRETL